MAAGVLVGQQHRRRDRGRGGPLLVASQTHDPVLVGLALLLQRLQWLLFGLWLTLALVWRQLGHIAHIDAGRVTS